MVFQSYAVFPHRKVRYNIGFGLSMAKKPKEEIDRKVAWAADLLQLGPYLDALLRLNFRSELKKIVKDLKTTTVYVTHDQSEALSPGDRVAVMRKGQIAQLGDPLDVYDAPADRFVGGFIGSPPMNFIKAAVSGDGGALIVGDQRLRAPSLLQSYSSTDVLLGVRAENVAVDTQRSSGDVPGTVLVVEPMGSSILLTVEVEGQTIKVQAPPTFRTSPGSTIWLTFSPNSMRFYDSETAMALVAR